jgi:hypothetical protein
MSDICPLLVALGVAASSLAIWACINWRRACERHLATLDRHEWDVRRAFLRGAGWSAADLATPDDVEAAEFVWFLGGEHAAPTPEGGE